MLVLCLKLSGLVPAVGLERAVQGELEARHQLLVVDGGADRVVSVPLLSQLQPVLLDGHLALDGAADLAPISGGVSPGGELEPAGGLGLNLELD